MHNCLVKSTTVERLSNTVHFCHKSITNPAITPQDKLILALANCKAALAGLSSSPAVTQAKDLQQLIQLTSHKLNPSTTPTMSHTPPTTDAPLPRVQPNVQHTGPQTDLQSHVAHPPTPALRVSPASNLPQRQAIAHQTAAQQRRIRDATLPVFLPSNPPAPAHDHVLNRPFNRPLRPLVPVATNRGAHAPPKFPLNPLPPPRLGTTPIRNLPATPTRCRIFLQAGSSRPLAHLSPPSSEH